MVEGMCVVGVCGEVCVVECVGEARCVGLYLLSSP